MSNAFDDKQNKESQQPKDGEIRGDAGNPQQKVAAANEGEPAPPEIQAEVPPRPDPEGVKLTMQTLRSFVEQHAFTFALFSLDDNLEYLFGHQSNPAEFLSAAEQLCGEGYILMGGGESPNFLDWNTFQFRFSNCSYPPDFIRQVLKEALTLALSDAGPLVH